MSNVTTIDTTRFRTAKMKRTELKNITLRPRVQWSSQPKQNIKHAAEAWMIKNDLG